MKHRRGCANRLTAVLVAAFLSACAVKPVPPAWRMDAQAAMEQSLDAYLAGNARLEAAETDRARAEIARAGRPDLLARAELMRCAAQVAALVFEPCAGYERHRVDAAAPEQAYADYLAARLRPDQVPLLPTAHHAAARWVPGSPVAPLLTAIDDPLARLIAAAVILKRQLATVAAGTAVTPPLPEPALLAIAVDTASAQGWRRPLLAWLHLQARDAQARGDAALAAAAQRRLELVSGRGLR
jgi:hypothetical protein